MPRRTIMLLVAAALVTSILPVTGALAAVTVENGTVASFDGAPIAYTFAHPDGTTPSPVVLMTHGWGGSRTKDFTGGTGKMLLDNGYAVLTWDARGFGESGGEANVDSQEYEVKDVQALLDDLANRTTVLLDGPGDPRFGMVGGSYAGGIQLMLAAADNRVDAIIPSIAWNDLPRSLRPGGILKNGWDLLLYGAGAATATTGGLAARQTGAYAPQIHQSLVEGLALNDWSGTTLSWFDAKSPKHYVNGNTAGGRNLPGINAPALILQGTSDTLFNLNEGVANYKAIAARGVPAKMIGYCGGHTITAVVATSCSSTGTSAKLNSATLAWLDKYVKGNATVDTGAPIELQLQDGAFTSLTTLPAASVSVDARTVITNTIAPTTGQVTAGTSGGCRPPTAAEKGKGPGGLTPSRDYVIENPYCAGEWVEIARYGDYVKLPTCWVPGEPANGRSKCELQNFHLPEGAQILGSGRVDLDVTGLGTEATIFLKLVDYDTVTKKKTVIDDQVTALKVTGFGQTQSAYASVDLAGVAWKVLKNHHIYLEITPTSNDHAVSRLPFSATLNVAAHIPVVDPA